MIDPISLAAISAVATVLTDRLTGGLLSKIQRDAARKAFEQALAGAIQQYAATDLRLMLAKPLLKKKGPLLNPEVAEELTQVVRFEREPDIAVIARHWKDAVENPPESVDFNVEAQILLRYLRLQLLHTEVFHPVFEAKSLEAIATSTAASEESLTAITGQFNALIGLMNDRFGELSETFARASGELRNEIRDYTLFIQERTRQFVGRRFVFDAIDDFMAKNPRGYFIVRGEPGIGKSALAAQFVKNKGCLHHFNIRAEGINRASHFIRNICAQLIVKYGLDYKTFPARATQDGGFLSELLLKASEKTFKVSKTSKVLIVVDALDEVDQTDLAPGANPLFLPKILPDNVYMVLTTRPVNSLNIECEQESFTIQQDAPDNIADIREYLKQSVTQPGIQAYIARHGIDNDLFVEHLAEKSQGNFMYLRHVLPEIDKGDYADWELKNIPAGLQNYYEDHWQRMRGRDEDAWFKYKLPVIVALTQVNDPVSIDLIGKFSDVDERTRIITVLQEWKQFLYETDVEYQGLNQKRYRVYHATFTDFLKHKDEVKEKGVDLKLARKKITNVLRERWAKYRG